MLARCLFHFASAEEGKEFLGHEGASPSEVIRADEGGVYFVYLYAIC